MIKGMLKGFVAAGLGLALTVSVAEAQKPAPEIGVWFVGLNMTNPDGDDNNNTNFNIGDEGGISVAFYINERIAIEPNLNWSMDKAEAADDATSSMGIGAAVPIYLAGGWGKAGGFYVAPHVGMFRIDPGAADAVSQNHVGVSVGTKMEITNDFFWRVAATYDMGLENDDFASNSTISLRFGATMYLP